MLRRLGGLTAGFFVLAACVAFAVGVVPGCYNPPMPVCGFVCGQAGACPSSYTCNPVDQRCHRNDTPLQQSCDGTVDAAILDAPDAPPDMAFFDAPDAPPDMAFFDAPDAPPDAPPDAAPDAHPDAPPDAPPDATFLDAPDAM